MKHQESMAAKAAGRRGNAWINFGFGVVIVAMALAAVALIITGERNGATSIAQSPVRAEAVVAAPAPEPAQPRPPAPEAPTPDFVDNHPPTF